MGIEDNFKNALKELRKAGKKSKFDETVDLIVNLKNFDARKDAFSMFLEMPVKIKDKKIAGFFEKDSKVIDTIKKEDFPRYKEKKDVRRLVKEYDFFIANAKLMPSIATSFGRVLGPAGKMPSPQLGILTNEDDNTIKQLNERINSTLRVRVKEPSIKIGIAKESFKDEDIVKNAVFAYQRVLESLPKKIDNVRNIKIKFTMGKPTPVKL